LACLQRWRARWGAIEVALRRWWALPPIIPSRPLPRSRNFLARPAGVRIVKFARAGACMDADFRPKGTRASY
jgi:hypothetical protein